MAIKHQHQMEHEHEEYDDSDDSSSGVTSKAADGSTVARPPPKKRNRAALSCVQCRERKVKCDRVIPCQQCIKRGDADFCQLDPNKKGPQSHKQGQGRKSQSQQQQQEAQSQETSFSYQREGSSLSRGQSATNLLDGSSVAEVDAIKARLAQLEQVIAQGAAAGGSVSGSSPSFSIPSSSSFSPNSANTLQSQQPSRPSWLGGTSSSSSGSLPTFTTSPANQFAQPQRSSIGSTSQQSPPLPISKMPNFFSQQNVDESLTGRANSITNNRSPNGANNYTINNFSTSDRSLHRDSSSEQLNGTTSTNSVSTMYNFGSLSSFATENGSGTDKSSTQTNSNHRGDVDSDTEDAALVLEGLAMNAGRNECEKKAKQDVIRQPFTKSIEAFVEDDKAKDIMSEGRYHDPNSKSAKDVKIENRGALPLTGPADDCEEGKNDGSCAMLAELLKADPDAEFGPDGKRIPPAKKVCVLLARHQNSLFNLVYGPETFLGWGMGWAFAAAEAAGDMMKVSDVVGCKGALQREAVLRAIIRSLPDRQSAEHLIDVYESRVKFLAGNGVHMPTFKREMAAFYELGTIEKRARVINFVDPGWLSLFLMMLVCSLHFHPCERQESVMHFFDGRTVHLWRSAAQTALVLARYQSSTSMVVLQALMLVNFYTMCIGKNDTALKHIAITNAIEMGLHRLGSKEQQPKEGENPSIIIRRELAKRIWYFLLYCDWGAADKNTNMYRIHPSQFNTPLPGNYNDSDLCISPLPAPRPSTEHTDSSFLLAAIQVATVIRENVDMQNATQMENGRLSCSDAAYLDGRYRGLLEQAPSFYRIGSNEGESENTEVERWLYQQMIFDKLLRLHRPNLSSKAGARTSCVLLARSILDMQRRIRSRCSVVDRLFMKLGQSFSAAIVLCLDLLQTPPSANMRDIVRGEVFEALQALRLVGATHHATGNHVRVIEALLEEEEVRWKQNEVNNGGMMRKPSGPLRKKNLLNLAQRVAKATQGEEPFKPSTGLDGEKTNADVIMMDAAVLPSSQVLDSTQSAKDEQSRRLMEQLLMGKPAYDEPSSFSRAPFQANTSGQPSTLFDVNQLDLTLSFPNYNDESNNPSFDLSKFLAECDTNSSPGSVGSGQANYEGNINSGASDSGHSSLHGGGSGGSRMSHSSSQSHLGNSSANQSPINAFKVMDTHTQTSPIATVSSSLAPSPNSVDKSTGLDGFWNWILAQGSIPTVNADKPQAPLGTAPIPSAQIQAASRDIYNNYAQNVFSHLQGNNNGQSKDVAVAPPLVNFSSPQPNQSSNLNAFSGTTPAAAASTGNEGIFSLGTPSAGIGSSWMNTPGLFDFALEASNNDNTNNGFSIAQNSQQQQQQSSNSAGPYWS